MKKILAIILVALLAASCVFAATSTKFTKYGNIFKSGEYTLRGTTYMVTSSGTKTGTGSPLVVAEHKGSYYMEVTSDGESVRILIMDNVYYLISDTEKMIISMAYEPEDEEDLMKYPVSYDVQSSGNAKLDGKTCYYEKTKESDGSISTYWYDGNNLYAIQSSDAIVYITSVEQKADTSLFTLPTGYDVMDLTDLSGLFGDWDDTDDYSDWYSGGSGWDNWDSYSGDGWTYDSSDSDYWWDDDTDYSPNYYSLGRYLGLTDSQAEEFSTAMYAIRYMDWGTLNSYATNGTFDFKGQKLEDVAYLAGYEMTAIKKLIEGFKK